ncbi:MAG: hypothetical protein HBSAPP03_13730 [Phycisphaerae bacterium]|nr:MAG: hypothetical protein HBSAPP03_13730 [Phycisphaerae bacterium]
MSAPGISASIRRGLGQIVAMAAALAVFHAPALAQPDPSGIDFVTITHPGNAAWAGNGTPGDRAVGRGAVGYEYRIGRYEVTTAQWVEFFNAAYDRADAPLPHLFPPNFWGAVGATPNNPGRQRWTVPAGNEMLPVGNISWRMAAMYCNWLHNDKSLDRAAFLNGAYDVSTFGYVGGSAVFTDQLTRHTDARFWIPSWDEWLKAAHYDPYKVNGDGTTGGWWTQPNGTNTPLWYGPPGVRVGVVNNQPVPDPNGPFAQANAGWHPGQFPGTPFSIPLGAYPGIASPFGLLDVAGATTEWTEGVISLGGQPFARVFDGSQWDISLSSALAKDLLANRGGDFPSLSTYDLGFRIASQIPGPWGLTAGVLLCIRAIGRSRKGDSHGQSRKHVRYQSGSCRGGGRV